MNGVPVPVVSRLLGHSNVQMTMRYAHLADRDIEAAAERVGAALARVMAGEAAVTPAGHAGALSVRAQGGGCTAWSDVRAAG